MNARFRIGIAGIGRMGQRHALNLAHRTLGAQLVAVCSPVASELEWAKEKLNVKYLYRDYKDLLAHPGLDAVFLVTPTTLHADQIIQGLQAGKHVFSEKPLALNIPDCLKVEQEAAKYPKQKVMIGFVRRFDPSYRDAYDKVKAGLIGRPFLVRSQTADQNDPSGFFVRFAPTSGGAMLDMSVHDIDVARWFLGAGGAKRVYAAGTIAIHKGLAECGDVDMARWRGDLRVATAGSRASTTRRGRQPRTTKKPVKDHRHGRDTYVVPGRTTSHGPGSRFPTLAARRAQIRTPTFWRGFSRSLPARSTGLCRCRAGRSATALDPARRNRSDAHRHRAHTVVAQRTRGGP